MISGAAGPGRTVPDDVLKNCCSREKRSWTQATLQSLKN